MTARNSFNTSMKHLKEEILEMGKMTANAINSSITSLKNQDSILAEKIIENDKDINIKQTKIEDMCVLLIAREQPVAGDLRKIITALKIVIQLERIGDYAVNIANAALRLADEKYIKPLIDIPEMGYTGIKMLNGALEAYMENNAEKAKQISILDDGIDKLYEQLLRELLTYMMENPSNIRQANSFLLIAKFLERMGDHVTNICEYIVFSASGKHMDLN